MPAVFWVRVSQDSLGFSAAHFLAMAGGTCERLHGHNYRVAASVFAPLDANQYVVDFQALQEALHSILQELDHRMLVPTQHHLLQVSHLGEEIEVRSECRRWLFPREDCVLLPVANTTAEQLAWHIGNRLLQTLKSSSARGLRKVRIEVEESAGQWAACEIVSDAQP